MKQIEIGHCDYFDYWGQGTQVTVTSATSTKPTVFPLMPCGSGTGTTVTLGCLATGFSPSPLTFAWNKNGAALTGSIQYPSVLKGEHYTGVSQIVVPKQDWDSSKPGQYKCAVTHSAGTGEAFFQKKVVVYKTPEVKVSTFSDEENEVSFICTATDFSPKDHQIEWLKNKVKVTDKITEFTSTKSGNGTPLYSVASILTMQSADVPALTEIICQFKGKNETGEVLTRDFLSYSPDRTNNECPKADVEVTIEPPTLEDIFVEKKGTITCHVKANKPHVSKIYWEDQNGDEIAGASMELKNGGTTHSLPLGITYVEWSQGIKFICVVEHSEVIDPIKTPYERETGVLTQRPSVFMMPPVEHIKKNMVTLTCFVKDFSPEEVFVAWLVDDELTKDAFNTTNPIKNHGSYSAYGQLSISLDTWKDAGSVYSCVVYHQSLDSNTRAIVRSIAYNTFDKLNLVNVSLNIPNTCKA
ncbi:unnamed protein product [Pleuronectes platessa]|uniref:Ig-like domain-containing protein n=1 Tax=Pleuronectes platessa TaxID=8262 RepID=A0A9N7UPT3_PLEPL|nr:unnamed protein product [Pleuronectes platessa]